ncbi:MAG: rhodanese-like domain-containing protein [Rhodoluna sp.]|jgi:rhodanese-related sulfurtransferase|nr:rhodanese-like domain-containing protein [Rhodoluna sp.]
MTKLRILFTAVLAVSLVAGLSACAPAKLDVSDVAAIIDIRSPEDFAASHITGATNIDYNSGGFFAYASVLKKTEKYYVYGKTSEQATEGTQSIRALGISNVTNLGSFEDAQGVLPLGVTK